MTKRWMTRGIRTMEARLGVELPHLHELERNAPRVLWALAGALPLLGYRRKAPTDLIHLVRIGATLAQDCGDCLQIALNVARAEGLSAGLVEAAVRGHEGRMTELQGAALRFGERVGTGLDVTAERELLAREIGAASFAELAVAASTAAVFPSLRRALGYSQACRLDLLEYRAS